jgi:hypothetical protein
LAKKSLTGLEQIEESYNGYMPAKAFKTWVSAYFRPAEVFNAEKKNAGGTEIAKILAFIGLVSAVVMGITAIIVGVFGLGAIAGPGGAALGLAGAVVAAVVGLILYPILMVIGGFIGSGIYYIIAKVFGGKGDYMEQTLGLALITGGYVLITAPFQILTLIPVIGVLFSLAIMLVGIYSLYSQYRLIKEVHKLSSMRAAAVVIIPIIVIVALIMLMIGFLTVAGVASGMKGY